MKNLGQIQLDELIEQNDKKLNECRLFPSEREDTPPLSPKSTKGKKTTVLSDTATSKILEVGTYSREEIAWYKA
jgi:hypothetical protein